MDNQMSLFDIEPMQMEATNDGCLKVVKAKYLETKNVNWLDLFEGYDRLYGITYSSGIQFMEKVFESFEHVEMIFGYEGVVGDDLAAVISAQVRSVEMLVKSKSAKRIARRMEEGTLDIRVSRDTKSHEKIFILKANDGRVRVITGSANMSASAFLGIQRENIVCFEEMDAYEYYKALFDDFKEKCSDSVSEKVMLALGENDDYLQDNIDETPIIQTVQQKKMVFLEAGWDSVETEFAANVKGMEAEIKPLIPRVKPENGKVLITGEMIPAFKRKYDEHVNVKKVKERKLPKLHIDYETKSITFNGKELLLEPTKEDIQKDIACLTNYINSLSSFHGDYRTSQRDYYKFFNWYFCSPFIPYLRYIGMKNEYEGTPFPTIGILYGDSNGGKTTFLKLLSKLMSGVKITPNCSNDFTATNINRLRTVCEGVPINIDDLAKVQYDAHFEKIIKEDNWGISERFINYPAIVISTNRLPSLKPDISKRVVTCRIDIKIDKEQGAYNSKRINESMKVASNALFCEYARRMFDVIETVGKEMQGSDETYFPDIFKESASVLLELFDEYADEVPEYVSELAYADYFSDYTTGRYAIEKIKTAWQTEPKMFKIDKKQNKLIYMYPEGGRLYELKYLQDELPPALQCQVTSRSLVMELDVAMEVFDQKFKKRILG